MTAVYNEHDPYAAAWLRHLIEEGEIPHGVVDERSIRDVEARDYRGHTQVHLFAGIGIWAAALRLAGWDDGRRVGTCSCPCQPFSAAGKGLGFADPRHLWPDAHRILSELRLDVVFGEQAPTAGHWIDLVASDLEADGYAFGAPVVPAAGFGGAHIRQRFYWVADAHNTEWWSDRAPRHERDWPQAGRVQGAGDAQGRGDVRRLEHAYGNQPSALGGDLGEVPGLQAGQRPDERAALSGGTVPLGGMGDADLQRGDGTAAGRLETGWRQSSFPGGPVWLGDAHSAGSPLGSGYPDERGAIRVQGPAAGTPGTLRGWDWLLCHDARIRPVEGGTFPLAPSHPGRVGQLRAYGNALDLETAANFVGAYLDAAPQRAAA